MKYPFNLADLSLIWKLKSPHIIHAGLVFLNHRLPCIETLGDGYFTFDYNSHGHSSFLTIRKKILQKRLQKIAATQSHESAQIF